MKINKNNFPEHERRYLSVDLEICAGAETENPRQVRGYAAVFDSESEILGGSRNKFVEKISRNAFADTDMTNVVCLFNHDSNYVLGRSKDGKGSMQMGIDERGLWYQLDMPNTTLGNDLLESIKRGDVQSSSFSFSIAEGGDAWAKEDRNGESILSRTISKIGKLYDTSLVVSPAYPDATVALRSLEQFQQEQEEEKPEPKPAENHFIAHRQRALDLIDKSAV
jgi:HK97 family phage prohead protease